MSNITQKISAIQDGVMHSQLISDMTPAINNIIMFIISLISLALICILSFYLVKRYLDRISQKEKNRFTKCAKKHALYQRIAYLMPIIIFYFGLEFIQKNLSIDHVDFLIIPSKTITISLILFISAITISSFLSAVEAYYKHFSLSTQFPIKSYVQVLKIICYIFTGILIISIILNKSPMYFLTGIGALTAVILLVFRDSILGFVASIQLTAYDMVRIGDWIEITSFGANGTVIDISLNTIKIRNFDNTIVTVPSYSLLSNGVKNWRGMTESGGRRFIQTVPIDATSVSFCNQQLLEHITSLPHLKEAVSSQYDIAQLHQFLPGHLSSISNLTLFRLYLKFYLQHHPKIHQGMTILVRELENHGSGIPLNLYMYTNDVNWTNYENIQSDILDHVYSMLPFFELRPFQYHCDWNQTKK